jgi:hypothetical protein
MRHSMDSETSSQPPVNSTGRRRWLRVDRRSSWVNALLWAVIGCLGVCLLGSLAQGAMAGGPSLAHPTLLAAQFETPDFMGQIQRFWSHFVQTGQIWAMLIGLVLGYIIRQATTYG